MTISIEQLSDTFASQAIDAVRAEAIGNKAAAEAGRQQREKHEVPFNALRQVTCCIADLRNLRFVVPGEKRQRSNVNVLRALYSAGIEDAVGESKSASVVKRIFEPAQAMLEGKLATSQAFLAILGEGLAELGHSGPVTPEQVEGALRKTQVSYAEGSSDKTIGTRNSLLDAAKAPVAAADTYFEAIEKATYAALSAGVEDTSKIRSKAVAAAKKHYAEDKLKAAKKAA